MSAGIVGRSVQVDVREDLAFMNIVRNAESAHALCGDTESHVVTPFCHPVPQ